MKHLIKSLSSTPPRKTAYGFKQVLSGFACDTVHNSQLFIKRATSRKMQASSLDNCIS